MFSFRNSLVPLVAIGPLAAIVPLVAIVPLLIASCRLPSDEGPALVTGFRCEPEAFDSFTNTTAFRYTLARPAETSLRITVRQEGRDSTITLLFTSLMESKGAHQHTWVGEGADGYFVRAGRYYGILETEGERYESVVNIFHR